MPDTALRDVAVIGGGLAGCAAAITLARAGRDVVLLEAQVGPSHKVCGEFLSAEALDDLQFLGIDPVALGAVPIGEVRFAGPHHVSAAALPFAAMSLTRRRLDEDLLSAATAAGVDVRRPCRVTLLATEAKERPEPKGARPTWTVTLANGTTLRAGEVMQASGKHDLPGRPRPKGAQDDLLAMKMYFRLTPEQAAELAEGIDLLLYPGGYAGLQRVEDGSANLTCLVRKDRFRGLRESGGGWPALLASMQRECPHLHHRLAGAEALLDKPLAISSIPYGFLRLHSDGPWYLGDQAAVIPSFTGDGMAIALHSGRMAATMLLAGAEASEFQQRLHAQLRAQVRLATALSRGLVSPVGQPLLMSVARLWPGTLRLIAAKTRVAAAHHATLVTPLPLPS